jgi:hypothetical protein
MPTVEEHQRLLKSIDTLLVEKGEAISKWRAGTFTAKEILEKADLPNTENHWRYIIHTMTQFYPDSTWERGSRDEGWKIRVRVRTR